MQTNEDDPQVVTENEFNLEETSNEVLKNKFGDDFDTNSDEAIEFMGTEEFLKSIESKQKTTAKSPESDDAEVVNKEEDEPSSFDLKNLDEDDYDLSNLKAGELKKAINAQNKQIREKYENETKEITENLEVTNTKLKEIEKEHSEMQEVMTALPGFLKTQGIEIGDDKNLQEQISNFILSTAAEKAGMSVKDYVAKAKSEEEALVEAANNVEKNANSAIEKFDDEIFKSLEIENKKEKLKNYLIEKKFDPKKDDVKKLARTLFMEEYDEALLQKGINEALKSSDLKTKGEPNTKGEKISQKYDVNEDKEFLAELDSYIED